MRMLPLVCLSSLLSGCMVWPKPVDEVQVRQPIVVAPKPVVAKKAAPVVRKPVITQMPASERGEGGGGWDQ